MAFLVLSQTIKHNMTPHLDSCEMHKDCVVAYTGHTCPVCQIEEDTKAAESRAHDAEEALSKLKEQLKAAIA